MPNFDPEGLDYDYETAKAAGLGPTGTGKNKGHWGSVTKASKEDIETYGLPDDSYIVLKGRQHETWNKAEEAEKTRKAKIVKRGTRYYSVPKSYSVPEGHKKGGKISASARGDGCAQRGKTKGRMV
jgi:hypothetical protein